MYVWISNKSTCTTRWARSHSPSYTADGREFESHPRQLIFSLKNDCLGRVVLYFFVFLLCCVAFLSKHLMDD